MQDSATIHNQLRLRRVSHKDTSQEGKRSKSPLKEKIFIVMSTLERFESLPKPSEKLSEKWIDNKKEKCYNKLRKVGMLAKVHSIGLKQ